MLEADSQANGSGSRFAIRERLGAGGMGVVYRAHDRERDTDVALKLLRQVDPAAIFRFKHEFRSLAGIVHRNLVPLYELVSTGEQWFFTMELVEGSHFLDYVRGDDGGQRPAPAKTAEVSGPTATGSAAPHTPPHSAADSNPEAPEFRDAASADWHIVCPPEALQRLRGALVQLVEGAMALHQAGHLHRDIKPSNVMVTREGRVVLLDFGIVTALADQGDLEKTLRIIGTPSYMAPEQASGGKLTEKSDWYAVGVILYEALTDQRPFRGNVEDVLHAKRAVDPVRPGQLATVPADLDALCMDLLARDPSRRPTGPEILARLGETSSVSVNPEQALPVELPIVGRERELGVLRDAFATASSGTQCTVLVHGSSGMGKSALVERFLDELIASGTALVLAGRCYEQESVPYKAVDSLVDAISRHLLARGHKEKVDLEPEEAAALARLFPVFRGIEQIESRAALAAIVGDPLEQRRRAFAGLRRLLGALGHRRPLVLYVDDLQWGDQESAHLLEDVLRPPDTPPALLIANYRSENAETSPFLRSFIPSQPKAIHLAVARLSLARARDLALELLSGSGAEVASAAEAIARESGGNPLFVIELVRSVIARGGIQPSPQVDVSLEDVLRARIESLPDDAQRLLQVIAVASRPIPQGVARRAAGLEGGARAEVLLLRSARLLRSQGIRDSDRVECYHDRIRETVVACLAEKTLEEIHRGLATELEQAGEQDFEAIAAHFERAPDPERAAIYYARAAARAYDALAFDRAAALYERVLELDPPQGEERSELLQTLGDVLSCAGRAAAAAKAYQEAATGTMAIRSLECRRRAAESLLFGGLIEEGVEEMTSVLRDHGVKVPSGGPWTIVSLLLRRAWIRLRGLGYRKSDAPLGLAEQQRIDSLWSATSGFAMINTIVGAEIQTRHLLASLGAGEEHHIARALAAEACYTVSTRLSGEARARALVQRAIELAESLDDDVGIVWARSGQVVTAYLCGHFPEARETTEKAGPDLLRRSPWRAWELVSLQLYNLWSLFQCGEAAELKRRVPAVLRDAHQRGDLYTVANVSTGVPNFAWLVDDRIDEARAAMTQAMQDWSPSDFTLQHYWELIGLTHVDLYAGQPEPALARLLERWSALERSLLLRMPFVRIEGSWLKARAHLGAAAIGRDRARNLAVARRLARRMARIAPWSKALADLVCGGVAALRGESERAADIFATAAAQFDALGMSLHAIVARHRCGALRGGDEGARLMREADDEMRAQEIVRPDRVIAMFAPDAMPG